LSPRSNFRDEGERSDSCFGDVIDSCFGDVVGFGPMEALEGPELVGLGVELASLMEW